MEQRNVQMDDILHLLFWGMWSAAKNPETLVFWLVRGGQPMPGGFLQEGLSAGWD
jgi:hypothetical protein